MSNSDKDRRFRLLEDADGHTYIIPVDEEQDFDRWLANAPYWETYEGRDYNDCRISGCPSRVTFTDPIEDE